MASWAEFSSYMRENYKILQEQEDLKLMFLGFRTEDDRSQQIVVAGVEDPDGNEWVKVSTPVSSDTEDLYHACFMANQLWCGGIGLMDTDDGALILLTESFPLENLDVNEVENSIKTIVVMGDSIEQQLSGDSDRF